MLLAQERVETVQAIARLFVHGEVPRHFHEAVVPVGHLALLPVVDERIFNPLAGATQRVRFKMPATAGRPSTYRCASIWNPYLLCLANEQADGGYRHGQTPSIALRHERARQSRVQRAGPLCCRPANERCRERRKTLLPARHPSETSLLSGIFSDTHSPRATACC